MLKCVFHARETSFSSIFIQQQKKNNIKYHQKTYINIFNQVKKKRKMEIFAELCHILSFMFEKLHETCEKKTTNIIFS